VRICSVVNSLTTGGAEVLVCALSSEFAAMGDRSLVIALCDAETVGNSTETEQRMAQRIRADGGEFLSLGLTRARNPISGAQRLRKALASFVPDVLHAHTVRALPMRTLGRSDVPTVLTHHNTRFPFPPRVLGLVDRMTDSYVAIGADVDRTLRQHVRKPIVRIPNCANRTFKAGPPRLLPSGVPSILSVGAISRQKNYSLLVEVAATLKFSQSLNPLPHFRIAGGGAELPAMKARACDYGVEDMVDFLGERSDVPQLMQDADLYLNVSLYEGMPLTLLEAMASGLPIVATDVPGNRELVVDGLNGAKAPLADAETIAQTITAILTDADRYRQLSEGSVEKSGEYSIERTASQHRDLYAGLIADRAGRMAYPPKEVIERDPSPPQ